MQVQRHLRPEQTLRDVRHCACNGVSFWLRLLEADHPFSKSVAEERGEETGKDGGRPLLISRHGGKNGFDLAVAD